MPRPSETDPVAAALAFRFRSGRPALDLTATLGRRGQGDLERLRSPADLDRWFVEAGLARRPVGAADRDLRYAHRLREALYRLLITELVGTAPTPSDVTAVNRAAARGTDRTTLVIRDGRLAGLATAPTVAGLLAVVARDATDLLTGPQHGRIRECERADCTILFLDSSPAGRRRWCSMDDCGARTKMAAYRNRRRPA